MTPTEVTDECDEDDDKGGGDTTLKWHLEGIGEGLDSEGGGESGMQQQACGLWISWIF